MRILPALLLTLVSIPVTAGASPAVIENPFGMRFVRVPAGEFTMGTQDPTEAAMMSPDADEAAIQDETPAHPVRITRDFWLGETEVTQSQWLSVMENRPGPTSHWQRPGWRKLPVVSVNWHMARRFVEELSKLDPSHHYRLPTEAEWEYAARAGSDELFAWPEDQLEDHAWFIHNSDDRPQPVATRTPNAWGLYDMIGNAWEWTADWYAPDTYSRGAVNDPQGPAEGIRKVRRGGSYHCPLHMTRVGYRAADDPGSRWSVLGLRVVAEPVSKTDSEIP